MEPRLYPLHLLFEQSVASFDSFSESELLCWIFPPNCWSFHPDCWCSCFGPQLIFYTVFTCFCKYFEWSLILFKRTGNFFSLAFQLLLCTDLSEFAEALHVFVSLSLFLSCSVQCFGLDMSSMHPTPLKLFCCFILHVFLLGYFHLDLCSPPLLERYWLL